MMIMKSVAFTAMAATAMAAVASAAPAQTYVESMNIPDRPVSGVEAQLEDSSAFVVVGVLDSGINPYHARFQRREAIPDDILGQIGVTKFCNLTFSTAETVGIQAALDEDADACWNKINPGDLVHYYGTSVVTYFPPGGDTGGTISFDENGHGTATAAAVLNGDNEAIILSVEDFLPVSAYEFLARHPAIDIMTESFGYIANLPIANIPGVDDLPPLNREGVVSGKLQFGACGNEGSRDCVKSEAGGPPWSIGVSGSSNQFQGKYYGSSAEIPDFVSDFEQTLPTVYTHNEYRNWGGTSFSCPLAAGVAAAAVHLAREAACDYNRVGPKDGYLVVDEEGNGLLANNHFRDTLELAAEFYDATEWNPAGAGNVYPALPVVPLTEPLFIGWGETYPDQLPGIVGHLTGMSTLPSRGLPAEQSMAALDEYKNGYWATVDGPVPPKPAGDLTKMQSCIPVTAFFSASDDDATSAASTAFVRSGAAMIVAVVAGVLAVFM